MSFLKFKKKCQYLEIRNCLKLPDAIIDDITYEWCKKEDDDCCISFCEAYTRFLEQKLESLEKDK